MSALYGADYLEVDTYMRSLNLRELAEASYELMPTEEQEILQAYCDGVNDFVSGIKLFSFSSTARLLPLEFYYFGLSK